MWEIVLVIKKNFWDSRLIVKNLQNIWDYYNNLFKQWKAGQAGKFYETKYFLTCSWRLSTNKLEQFKFNLEKIIGNQKPTGKFRTILLNYQDFNQKSIFYKCTIITFRKYECSFRSFFHSLHSEFHKLCFLYSFFALNIKVEKVTKFFNLLK